MTIPIVFRGRRFPAGKALESLHILDIAPTILDIMGLEPGDGWEGHSILADQP